MRGATMRIKSPCWCLTWWPSECEAEVLPTLQKSSVSIPEEQMRTGSVIFLEENFIQNCVKFNPDNRGPVCKLNAWFGSSKFVWFDCCIDVSQDSSSVWSMNYVISQFCTAWQPYRTNFSWLDHWIHRAWASIQDKQNVFLIWKYDRI